MTNQERIDNLENMIADLRNDIDNYELDPDDFEDQYCEMLNCEGPVTVCGIEFEPSDILKEMDPIAYRCGLNDYVDGIELTEDERYNELVEELEELETELQDLYDELEE
jgi:hypothetical protein